jgi:rubrerythrin
MLSKLGYQPGSALGAAGNMNGVLEPVAVEIKAGREGVGMANERKRKVREADEEKRDGERQVAEDYRERIAREREARRFEGLLGGAMRVLEGMEEETTGKKVNVLYRGLVRQRREEERERRARYDLHQSLSRSATYQADEEEEKQDRLARSVEEEDEGNDDRDEELEAFEALTPGQRLERIVGYLRDKYWYCFWCKSRYEDAGMEGCPGLTEDDHD